MPFLRGRLVQMVFRVQTQIRGGGKCGEQAYYGKEIRLKLLLQEQFSYKNQVVDKEQDEIHQHGYDEMTIPEMLRGVVADKCEYQEQDGNQQYGQP